MESFKGHMQVFIRGEGLEDKSDGVKKKKTFQHWMWLNISRSR